MTGSTPKKSISNMKEPDDSNATAHRSSKAKGSQKKSVEQSGKNKNVQNIPTSKYEDPSTAEEQEYHPISHPRLPITTPPRYFVNKHGDVCSDATGKRRPLQKMKGKNIPSYVLSVSKNKNTPIKLEEIMVYTFLDPQFDSDKQWIFHKDGQQENCASDNLVVCDLPKLQRLEIERLENLHQGTKYTVVRNAHDTLTFERYLVSDNGDVYSLRKRRHLQPSKLNKYQVVMLTSDDDTVRPVVITVHTIVIRSFKGIQVADSRITYINGDKNDLSLANLEYASQSGTLIRANQPNRVKARELQNEREDVPQKDKLRPLPPISYQTIWRYINVLPWNGRSYCRYQVSNMGHVRRVGDVVPLKQYINRGYVCVHLYRDMDNWNAKKVPIAACTVTVSRIVAKAFVRGYSKTKNSVKHRNGDRQDNRAENLEWVDRKSSTVNRRSRMVKASLVDDPHDKKEFESILKAERMLSTFHLSYHDAKHNGEPFIREVTWDGRKQKVLFRIFPSELQSFQRL